MMYVDELRNLRNLKIRGYGLKHAQKGCFLFCENDTPEKIKELHNFAMQLNISKELYKGDEFLPRYILIGVDLRKKVIIKGAIEVSFRKTVFILRQNKNRRRLNGG